MPYRRLLPVLLFSLIAFAALPSDAQDTPAAAGLPKAGSSWANVKALPPRAHVHITMNHGSRNCYVFEVSDDTLTCAKGSAPGAVIQRAEIRHIKMAHYGRSTLAGAALGGGIGALSGAIAGRTPPCTGFCFNILGPGAVAAIFGVGGGVLGAAVGGPTDFTRGSSIYVRP